MNSSGPQTYVVDPSGAGNFITIQAALNAADSQDTILVQPGIYAEDVTFDPAKNQITLQGKEWREAFDAGNVYLPDHLL